MAREASNKSGERVTRCDVAVIGAGAGGLASALRLAREGLNVHVFERGDRAGGKIGVSSHEGVSFDTGPSLLTMREHIDELFEACGTTASEEISLITHSPGFRYMWPDGARLDVHHELEMTREEVQKSFGSEARGEFDAFLAYSKAIWEAALPNFVESEAPSFGSILKLGVTKLREVRKIDPFRSMLQGISRHVSEPHLRDVMMRYATYNGSNALQAPATLNCIAWVELGLGGHGIAGGMSALPDALARVGERLGVTFHYGKEVCGIEVEGSDGVRAIEVRDGEDRLRVRADQVVVNADVAHMRGELLGRDVNDGLGEAATPSMSGWTGVMRGAASEDRAPHTVLFPERYEGEFEDIFTRDRPPQDPTVYLCDQHLSHARAGWSDGSVPIFVMANAPCEPEQSELSHDEQDARWGAYRERILGRLKAFEKELGLENIREEDFVWERTPAQLAEAFPGSRGAIYGAASNSQTAAFKRPPNRIKAIRGLYLATGSAHPGGGVPLCILSGKMAAQQLLEDRKNRR